MAFDRDEITQLEEIIENVFRRCMIGHDSPQPMGSVSSAIPPGLRGADLLDAIKDRERQLKLERKRK